MNNIGRSLSQMGRGVGGNQSHSPLPSMGRGGVPSLFANSNHPMTGGGDSFQSQMGFGSDEYNLRRPQLRVSSPGGQNRQQMAYTDMMNHNRQMSGLGQTGGLNQVGKPIGRGYGGQMGRGVGSAVGGQFGRGSIDSLLGLPPSGGQMEQQRSLRVGRGRGMYN